MTTAQIVLPPEFVPIKYPGYFWNTKTKQLFSVKVTETLKPLTYFVGGYFHGHEFSPGYRISYKGQKITVSNRYLHSLKPLEQHYVFPKYQ